MGDDSLGFGVVGTVNVIVLVVLVLGPAVAFVCTFGYCNCVGELAEGGDEATGLDDSAPPAGPDPLGLRPRFAPAPRVGVAAA